MKNFEPHYRLVRYGQATKIEKASRQQREYIRAQVKGDLEDGVMLTVIQYRQAEEEQGQGAAWHGEDEGCGEEEEISGSCCGRWHWRDRFVFLSLHEHAAAEPFHVARCSTTIPALLRRQ